MTCNTPIQGVKFRPNYKHRILAEKFYARHEQPEVNQERVLFYVKELEKRQEADLRTQFTQPITENQVYGWLEKKAFRYKDELDQQILCHPKRADEVMKALQRIAYDINCNRIGDKFKK